MLSFLTSAASITFNAACEGIRIGADLVAPKFMRTEKYLKEQEEKGNEIGLLESIDKVGGVFKICVISALEGYQTLESAVINLLNDDENNSETTTQLGADHQRVFADKLQALRIPKKFNNNTALTNPNKSNQVSSKENTDKPYDIEEHSLKTAETIVKIRKEVYKVLNEAITNAHIRTEKSKQQKLEIERESKESAQKLVIETLKHSLKTNQDRIEHYDGWINNAYELLQQSLKLNKSPEISPEYQKKYNDLITEKNNILKEIEYLSQQLNLQTHKLNNLSLQDGCKDITVSGGYDSELD